MSATTALTPANDLSYIERPSSFLMPIVVAWMLMIFTFSIGSDFPGGDTLDALVSKLKYGLRAIAVLLLFTVCMRNRHQSTASSILLIFVPLLSFSAWAFLSAGWSALLTLTLAQSVNLLSLVLLAITFAFLCRSKRDVQLIVRQLCTGLLTISAGLLLLKLAVPSLYVMEREGTGLFHATNTAGTASVGLVLLVSAHCLWNTSWTTRLLMIAVPVQFAVLYLSTNRLSVAITVLIISLYALSYTHRAVIAFTMFCVCSIGLLYLAVDPGCAWVSAAGGAVGDYAGRGQSVEELSAFSGREEMWDVMWQSFRESPWIGHGYFVSSSSGELEVWFDEGNYTAHNTVLQVLVSTGVIGMGLLLTGLAVPVGFSLWQSLNHPEGRQLTILLLTMAFWFFVWGLMNESFMGPLQPESVVFFSVLGMLVGRSMELRRCTWERQMSTGGRT